MTTDTKTLRLALKNLRGQLAATEAARARVSNELMTKNGRVVDLEHEVKLLRQLNERQAQLLGHKTGEIATFARHNTHMQDVIVDLIARSRSPSITVTHDGDYAQDGDNTNFRS